MDNQQVSILLKNQFLDYENYVIYSDGRVWSLFSKRFLKPFCIGRGKDYLAYKLCKEGRKEYTVQAHRLVARTFISNPNNYLEVNHINGIKTDNRVENLEWCTHSQNVQHAVDTGLLIHKSGESHCRASLTKEEVVLICKKFENGEMPKTVAKPGSRYYDIVSKIYTRDNWTTISENYKWDIKTSGKKESIFLTKEDVIFYCSEFEKGKKAVDFFSAGSHYYDKLRKIHSRVTHKEISKDYNW